LSDLRESGCVSGDTLIINAETGERIPIKALAERAIQSPFTCLGTEVNYKVKPQQLTKAFYSGQKEVFELKTRSGKTIKASANHPFLKLQGWTRLDELKVGDRIATPRKINIEKPSNPLSSDELILLAHLLGDGCVLPRQPYHYTSADLENIEIVRETAQRLFGIEAKCVKQENWWHLYLTSPYRLTHGKKHPITIWYEKLGIERVRSYQKELPKAIFQCDEAHIALFLKHLWATDGNISWKNLESRKKAGAIYYATSSKVLATQIQHLLLRLGIQNTSKEVKSAKQYRNMYHIHITGAENQIYFLEKVGCVGTRGKIIPELLSSLHEIDQNPNFDVIPKEVWESVIKNCKDIQNISWRTFAKNLEMQYCGSTLFKHGVSRERMQRIAQILPFQIIKNLAESDILWDEITSITPLGLEDVYDATVASVHNFVANDIILHNSIEQDADMVLFLYRPEYYGITQDMEGNPTANMGEVIIAKHRNGSLKDVKLKFIGKFTKFENLETEGFNFGNTGNGSDNSKKTMTFSSKANETNNLNSFNNTQNQPRLDDEPPF
jgi:replicative DNA helicase